MRIVVLFTCIALLTSCQEEGSSESRETRKVEDSTPKNNGGGESDSSGKSSNKSLSTDDVNGDPANVVMTIFQAAYSQNLSKLSSLCHPEIETDQWGRQVCMIAEAQPKGKDAFIGMFEQGRIVGKVTTENGIAQVPVVYGPDAVQDGTVWCVEKDGKWYLHGFSPPGSEK